MTNPYDPPNDQEPEYRDDTPEQDDRRYPSALDEMLATPQGCAVRFAGNGERSTRARKRK